MDIGPSIRKARKAKGWTLEELANAVETDTGNLSRLERGLQGVSQDLLNKILTALGMTISLGSQDSQADSVQAPSEADYALIPQLTAKGSSGNGYLNDHIEVKGGLAFKRDWLRRMGLKAENLRVAYNHGESNWPTLTDGEVVLIDVSCRDPANGKMFALHDADQQMIFKRLIREITGGWLIRSDNQDKTRYPDQPVTDEGMRGVDIIGRIVWRGGAM